MCNDYSDIQSEVDCEMHDKRDPKRKKKEERPGELGRRREKKVVLKAGRFSSVSQLINICCERASWCYGGASHPGSWMSTSPHPDLIALPLASRSSYFHLPFSKHADDRQERTHSVLLH